ncbi:hypothetical protein AB0M61_47340 [Streptomyces sp. NPDC051642]|uniref:hypothetical protein n=1 Tax=Streptomyces sp. NPDC051642 TaxID=3154646 RepID=UPI00341AAB7B
MNGRPRSSPFAVPPAVRTPRRTRRAPPALAGRPLWELENVADVYSPRLLPVRDVLVFGAASGGMAVYGVKDSCLSPSTG